MPFEGIFILNDLLVDQLRSYLEREESSTSQSLIQACEGLPVDRKNPQLESSDHLDLKFAEAVEIIRKKVGYATQYPLSSSQFNLNEIAKQISQVLWKFLEVLEISVMELFQQLDQTGVDEWRMELSHAVVEIKELLMHYLEELKWTFHSIDHQLREFKRFLGSQQKWKTFFRSFFSSESLLDPQIPVHITQCQKYLKTSYRDFSTRYSRYIDMRVKIELFLHHWQGYPVFSSLDCETKEKIERIYSLTKLWEMNRDSKSFAQPEVVRSLRNLMSPEKAIGYLKEYAQQLREALFARSRDIKKESSTEEKKNRRQLDEEVQKIQDEEKNLRILIQKYRDFLLRTDPNPYVRSRIGFPEWVAGPEPDPSKQCLSLEYDLEYLNSQFEVFKEKQDQPAKALGKINAEIQGILHEMSQPLRSKGMMKIQAGRFIKAVEQINELGSGQRKAVDDVNRALSKAMRADWKYQTLFDYLEFHRLVAIHLGILGLKEDRQHLGRVHKFRKIIKQIEHWLKCHDTPKHMHDIELEMNDIKECLQDFLAQAQRLKGAREAEEADSPGLLRKMEEQLLEYRYLFGQFFHHLREDNPEERMIRKQFLFVDQYFEAIEGCL